MSSILQPLEIILELILKQKKQVIQLEGQNPLWAFQSKSIETTVATETLCNYD